MVSVGLRGVTKLFRTWNEVMVNHIGAEIFSCSSRLPLAHDLIVLSEEKGDRVYQRGGFLDRNSEALI